MGSVGECLRAGFSCSNTFSSTCCMDRTCYGSQSRSYLRRETASLTFLVGFKVGFKVGFDV